MKLKNIFINLLPLPIWITYYLCTMAKRKLFLMPVDELIMQAVFIVFTLYNFLSGKTKDFLLKNTILSLLLTLSCLVCGKIYLEFFPHMSDDHQAIPSITLDCLIGFVAITIIVLFIKLIVDKVKKVD